MKKFNAPFVLALIYVALQLTGCSDTSLPPVAVSSAPVVQSPASKPSCQTDAEEVFTEGAYREAAGERASFYLLSRTAPDFFTSRLKSRYSDDLVQTFVSQVSTWNLHVSFKLPPGIDVGPKTFNSDCSLVSFSTRETWKVVSDETVDKGKVLFSETNAEHVITMKRVPGTIMEKWEVESISNLHLNPNISA